MPPSTTFLHLLLLSLSFLLLSTTSATSPPPPQPPTPPPPPPPSSPSATTIGVTYTPLPNLPPPEQVANTLSQLHISNVRLMDPTPSTIRAFSYSNISLLLSVPNSLLPSFAANLSSPTLWLSTHVVPFFPRARINVISLGDDVISSSSPNFSLDFDPSSTLVPAIRNLHLALLNYGIRNIQVSTTFTFINVMTTSFPPSRAEFQDPIGNLVIKPLLTFLDETSSSFLVNVYPYNVYRVNLEIPIGYALFQDNAYNFRDDSVTGVRYMNLYDMMVDSVIAAMAVMGYEDIPVIVTETGWPSSDSAAAAAARRGEGEDEAEVIANSGYAEMYLNGLVKHLRSGQGTPLRKEGAAEAYIYQLFDGVDGNGTRQDQAWGIMYNNMSLKYKIGFSSGAHRFGGKGFWLVTVILLILRGLDTA